MNSYWVRFKAPCWVTDEMEGTDDFKELFPSLPRLIAPVADFVVTGLRERRVKIEDPHWTWFGSGLAASTRIGREQSLVFVGWSRRDKVWNVGFYSVWPENNPHYRPFDPAKAEQFRQRIDDVLRSDSRILPDSITWEADEEEDQV